MTRERGLHVVKPGDPPTPPPPGDGEVHPPGTLSEGARDHWLTLAPHLPIPLTPGDVVGFTLLCNSLATYDAANESLAARILSYDDEGTGTEHPALRVRDKQDAIINRWLRHFGLTPDTRAKLAPHAPGSQSRQPRLLRESDQSRPGAGITSRSGTGT